MSTVSFRTKRGKKVSFSTSGRKRKGKTSPYNRFVAKKIRGRKSGQSVHAAMKAAAAAWRRGER